MSLTLLDGQVAARKVLERIASETRANGPKVPGLAVVRVGEDPASKVYVGKKIKTCRDLGFYSEEHALPESTTPAALLEKIAKLNHDSQIHGILLQLPLPTHLKAQQFLESISPAKDVDGFHPLNRGYLLSQRETFLPCTPSGIMMLLEHYQIPVAGKHAVVMGRSEIVGRPISLLLDFAGATVTVVHSKTPDPLRFTRDADLLIVAIGKPELVKADHLKSGAIVIDVGIHRRSDGSLCGDVDFASARERASALTPVPGGVGPMTIAGLMANTLKSFINSTR